MAEYDVKVRNGRGGNQVFILRVEISLERATAFVVVHENDIWPVRVDNQLPEPIKFKQRGRFVWRLI